MFRRSFLPSIVLAALTVPGVAAAASAPKSIVLRASDVPSNYHAVSLIKVATPQLSLRTLARGAYARHGRIGGYFAEFAPRRSTPVVSSLVVRYKSASGAEWELQNVRSFMNSHHLAATSVGDDSFAFVYQTGKKKTLISIMGIAFRRGPWAIEVTELGKPNAVTISDVVHYAQIVDGRAQHG